MTPPLTYPFLRYIESTRHLVLYRLNSSYPIPSMLQLPAVETVCFLHCEPESIGHVLYRAFFPGLRRIHYLSAMPQPSLLYERLPGVEWVFPWREGRVYPFYDAIVQSGRGRMETGLLSRYLVRWSGPWMDMYLPGRGIVSGEEYKKRQMGYFHKKHCDGYCTPYPIVNEDVTFPQKENPSYALSDVRWVMEAAQTGWEDRYDREILGISSPVITHL